MNLNNYKIWTLTDGSQGMISQVIGLAQEFGNEINKKNPEIELDVLFQMVKKWIMDCSQQH